MASPTSGRINANIMLTAETAEIITGTSLSAILGTIDADLQATIVMAGSATLTIDSATYGFGTGMKLLSLRCRSASSGNARSVTLSLFAGATEVTDSVINIPVTDLIYVCSENNTITKFELKSQAGEDTEVEYLLAGN